MNENIKIAFLKSAVYGYALMQEVTAENKNELWIKQLQQIKKYFSKTKPKGLIKSDINLLLRLQTKLKVIDSYFFEDKLFSPYICSILLLNYLMVEKQDIELRNRFSHLDIDKTVNEVELYFRKDDINKSHQKFIIKVLELVGE